ncbi:hypothetical protein Btru_046361 [Bulinus truncatus]|nr:hypothetical protein Btru_046361 [Bulinus truncatus]
MEPATAPSPYKSLSPSVNHFKIQENAWEIVGRGTGEEVSHPPEGQKHQRVQQCALSQDDSPGDCMLLCKNHQAVCYVGTITSRCKSHDAVTDTFHRFHALTMSKPKEKKKKKNQLPRSDLKENEWVSSHLVHNVCGTGEMMGWGVGYVPSVMCLQICAFSHVPPVMCLQSCASRYVPSVMCLQICAFSHVPPVMCLQSCAFSHVPPDMCLQSCASRYVPSVMCLQSCASSHVPPVMCLQSCAFSHVPPDMCLQSCASRYVPSVMCLQSCASSHVLPVMCLQSTNIHYRVKLPKAGYLVTERAR